MGHNGDQRFGDEEYDPVTFLHAQIQQRIGKPVYVTLQLSEGQCGFSPAVSQKRQGGLGAMFGNHHFEPVVYGICMHGLLHRQ